MIKVKALRDDSGHWYVVPLTETDDFKRDLNNRYMVNSGDFDAIYGHYRTGGDLNLIQLWAEI